MQPIYTPDKLPLSGYKLSASLPCVSYIEEPITNEGQLTDEYTYSVNGCSFDEFYNTANDSRFEQVPGFAINQGDLEDENYITDILSGRFFRNDAKNY